MSTAAIIQQQPHQTHGDQQMASDAKSNRLTTNRNTPKKVFLFCNGDKFFKGKKAYLAPQRYNNFTDLLNDLTGKLPNSPSLPYGVRQIFMAETGKKIRRFEDLQDGHAYVCAGFEHFRQLNYGAGGGLAGGASPPLSYAGGAVPKRIEAAKVTKQPVMKYEHKPINTDTKVTEKLNKSKRFTIVLNAVKPRIISKIYLSRQQVTHFESLLKEIQTSLGKSGAKARRLYTIKGQEVHSVGDFFRMDTRLIALGSEKFTTADLKEILSDLYSNDAATQKSLLKMWEKRRGHAKKRKESAVDGGGEKQQEREKEKTTATQKQAEQKPTESRLEGAEEQKPPPIEAESKKRDSGYYDQESSPPSVLQTTRTTAVRSPDKAAQTTPTAAQPTKAKASVIDEEPTVSPKAAPPTTDGSNNKPVAIQQLSTDTPAKQEETPQPPTSRQTPLGAETPAAKPDESAASPKPSKPKQPMQVAAKKPPKSPKQAPPPVTHGKMDEDMMALLKSQQAAAIPQSMDDKPGGMNKYHVLPKIDESAAPASKERSKSVPDLSARDKQQAVAAAEIISPRLEERESKIKQQQQAVAPAVAPTKEVEDPDIVKRNATPRSAPGKKVPGKMSRQISKAEYVMERFEYGKVLGDGNFAIVRQSKRKKTGEPLALKIIDKSKLKGKYHMIENEIRIMGLCDHKNIVRLYEQYETDKEIFLIMELVRGGDLFDAITAAVKFDEKTASSMVRDMADALFYLHSRGIVHRDMKPENLMVMPGGGVGEAPTLKLGDFGLAMEVTKPIYTICGTPTYVAPEILTEKGYGLEVDLWALGVINYILICGFPPFRSPERRQSELFEMIKKGKFVFLSPYWDLTSSFAKDLICRLLIVEKAKRFKAVDVLCHPWILSCGGRTALPPDLATARKELKAKYESEAAANLRNWNRTKAADSSPAAK